MSNQPMTYSEASHLIKAASDACEAHAITQNEARAVIRAALTRVGLINEVRELLKPQNAPAAAVEAE